MGAINYGTSDYITIGYKPLSVYELEKDAAFMAALQEEVNEYGGTLENALNDYIQADEEEIHTAITDILEKYDFYYFHVAIKAGYYEGFYIDIENNYGYCYDDSTDKRAAQREITRLKAFLIECVNTGLCQVYSGWITSYQSRVTSLQAIASAVKEMRQEVKQTPTYYTLQEV